MDAKQIAACEVGSIRFAYPANWTREVEESDEGVSISLQSPAISFALVGVFEPDRDPEFLLEQAVDSLREEHPGLELEELDGGDWDDACGAEAVFMSIDTVSFCWIRSGRVADQSLLVLMQSVEPESDGSFALFEAICRSVSPLGPAGKG